MVSDLKTLESSFSKAALTYERQALMQNTMGQHLCKYLKYFYQEHPEINLKRVLEIGCGPGNFTELFINSFAPEEMCLNDLSASMLQETTDKIHERFPKLKLNTICANALSLNTSYEPLAFPYDALISNATFQWFGSLDPVLEHFAPLLSTHKGCRLVAFASFYEGNFAQIKELTGLSLDYLTPEQITDSLARLTKYYQVHFDSHKQHFTSPWALFKSLKSTGVTALGNKPLSPKAFKRLLLDYQNHFSDEHGVYLSWHPYYVVALI